MTNGNITKVSHQQADNSLAVLKSIQLTPPTAANRHHHSRTPHVHQQQNGHANGFASDTSNNNFFNQQNNLSATSNGSLSHNGSIKSDNSSDFVADFSKASIYNSNNSLNSAGSGGGQVNGKTTNGGDMNANFANFADFDNNKIFNAAGEKKVHRLCVAALCAPRSNIKSLNLFLLPNLLFSFFFFLFRIHWHDDTLKLCENCPPSLFIPFSSLLLGSKQKSITIIIIIITQWPTTQTVTFNGTFGNNFNGPINPNRIVGVSRFCGLCCCKKNRNVC